MNSVAVGEDLRACRAIALQALQWRRSQGSMWLSWILAAVAVLFAVLALRIDSPDSRMLCVGIAGGAFSMLSMIVWTLLGASVARQYDAFAARLVPRARQRMMALLATVGLALALAEAALVGLPFGHPVLVFFASIFVMAESVLPSSWRSAVFFIVFAAGPLGIKLPSAWEELLSGPAGVALGLGVLVFEIRAAFRYLFGVGGRLPPARPIGLAQRGPRSASQARPSGGIELFVYGLGPVPPWRLCLRALWFWTGGSVMLGLVLLLRGDVGAPVWRATALGVVLVSQFTAVMMIADMLYDSRREQCLLRLSPTAPRAAALNSFVTRMLVSQTAWVWLASLAVAMVVFALTGAPWNQTLRAAGMVALMPFAYGGLFADYARQRSTRLTQRLGWFAVGLAGIILLLDASFGWAEPSAFARAAIGIMLSGAGLALLRWRAMLRAPVAFPTGRIG